MALGELDKRARHDAARPIQGERAKLPHRVRAGLDVARALTALYVVAHHVVGSLDTPKVVDVLFSFGQEAVLVFFLLSGFVIFANERHRVLHPRGYYVRRLRRIYPPILLAMLVSLGCAALGLISVPPTWQSALATIASVQDISFLKPGVVSNPFMGNDPLWSLSYEVFFYLVFPLVMIGWRASETVTRHGVGAIACLGYVTYLLLPNHLSLVVAYFLVWWIGAMAARVYLSGDLSFARLLPEFGWTAGLAAVAAVGVWVLGSEGLGYFPVLMVRHFVFALILLAVLVTPVRRLLGAVSLKVAVPAAALASISYGLYVLHYPLLVQSGASASLWFLPVLALTVALAWVADIGLGRLLPKAPKG